MNFLNKKVEDYEATTASSTTPVIDLTNSRFLGVQNSNDTTDITFYGSSDGTNYGVVYYNGDVLTEATTVANAYYTYDPAVFDGVKYLKITKDTAATIKIVRDIR